MKRHSPICAIDVGTNTVNTLVAEVRGSDVHVLVDEERFARLGQGVDAHGRLADEAIERVMEALRASVATAGRFYAESIVIGGTSASRDAHDVDTLLARVDEELGLRYEVLTGEEEAQWSALGALATLGRISEAVVVDIGGGSTEIVRVEPEGEVSFRESLNIGTVRLTERHFSSVPPSTQELRAARDLIHRILDGVPPELADGTVVVATGSTARVVAALLDAEMHAPMASTEARRLATFLLTLTPDEALGLSPDIVRGREDLVAAASLILSSVLDHFQVDAFIPSVGGLRHGLVLRAHAEAL